MTLHALKRARSSILGETPLSKWMSRSVTVALAVRVFLQGRLPESSRRSKCVMETRSAITVRVFSRPLELSTRSLLIRSKVWMRSTRVR